MFFTTRLIFFSFPGSQGVVFLSFCQVVRIGNRSPEWWCLKDKEGNSPQKQNKGKSEDQSKDPKENKQHSWLAQFTQGRPRGKEKTYKKRSQRAGDLSLSLSLTSTHWHTPPLSSSRLWVGMPSCLEDGFSCYFLNKIELQHGGVTLICL